jgi:hypothetical protein
MELVSPMADQTPQNSSSDTLMFCVSGNGVHVQWCQHYMYCRRQPSTVTWNFEPISLQSTNAHVEKSPKTDIFTFY